MALTPPYDHPVYKPGDVVVEAMPLIYVLDPPFVNSHCGGCFRPLRASSELNAGVEKLSKCGRCKQIQYCSRECQRFDWRNFHKYECPFYTKRESFFGHPAHRLALRCFILMKYRPEELRKQYDVLGGRRICYMNLIDHANQRPANDETDEVLQTICLLFSEFELEVDLNQFKLILYKFYINSFTIADYDSENIGAALYIKTSIFDHSCAPNTSFNFLGLKQQVRAIKDIPARAPISTEYFEIFELRRTRQERLLRTHFFTCTCVRCLSDPSDDGIIMEIQSLKERIDKLNEKSDPQSEDSKLLAELYEKLVPLFKQIIGQYYPSLTDVYVQCLELKLKTNTHHDFDLQEIEDAIRVTHGTEHPLYDYFNAMQAGGSR